MYNKYKYYVQGTAHIWQCAVNMYNKYKYYVQGTAHIWQCAVNMYNESSSGRVASSEEEIDNPDGKDIFEEPFKILNRT